MMITQAIAWSACAGLAWAAQGAQHPLGSRQAAEVLVNAYTENRQQQPSCAADAGGRSFVAWSSRRQEFGTEGVFGQWLDPLGRPLGGELHVNEFCRGHQGQPAVAMAPAGTAWVAWSSSGQDGDQGGIYLRRFGQDGALGPEVQVAESMAGDQSDPVIAYGEGRALVCWVHTAESLPEIRGRYFRADGAPEGDEFRVSEAVEAVERLPVLAALGGGRFLAAWARARTTGEPFGVYGRILGGDEFRLDEGDLLAVEPSVDAAADGSFVAAWMAAAESGEWYPLARRFDRAGRPLGPSACVPVQGGVACNGVTVAVAPDGRYAVAWNETGTKRGGLTAQRPSLESTVWAQVYGADGAAVGEPFRVHAAVEGFHTLHAGHNARHALWTAHDQLAFAWHGALAGDDAGVGLSLSAPASLQVPAPPAGERLAAVVTREQFEYAPPEWDPNWVDDSRVPTPPPAGPDFGFTAFNSTGWIPPDPDLAVGPDHIVVVVNVAMQIYTKAGQSQFYTNLEPFFNTNGFVFDPTALYDPHSGRFVIAACEHALNGDDYLDVAVSDDSDPNGTWHKYRFNLSSFCDFIDFDNLGVARDVIYLAGDCFGGGGNNLFVLNKAPMLSGLPVTPVRVSTSGFVISTGATKNYDANNSNGYFLSTYAVGSPFLTMYAISDPLGTPRLTTFNLNVGSYNFPPDAQQQGTSVGVDTIDWRIKNGVVRNGKLYAVHNVDGGDGAAKVRWYEINLNGWPTSGANPTLFQSGLVNPGSNIDAWHADVNVDATGNMAIAYNRSSPNELISVERTGRLTSDNLNTLRPPVRQQISSQPDLSGRWGDYSGLEEDPVESGVFWNHNEYALSSWRTWCGKFTIEGRLNLVQSILVRGNNAVFTVDNANAGETIGFLYSLAGTGAGPCPPQLGGLCLDLLSPVQMTGTAVASGNVATLIGRVPPNAPLGASVWSQAVAQRGILNSDSVKSNVTVEVIQ